MNQQKHEENIPTLTSIIHPGDESMENHFDASYFDDNQLIYDDMPEPFISDEIKTDELDEEKEIIIADSEQGQEHDIDVDIDTAVTVPGLDDKELKKAIDFIISDAVQEIMPEVERQLTKQITEKVLHEIFHKDSDN